MPLNYNNTNIYAVNFNNTPINRINYNSNLIWGIYNITLITDGGTVTPSSLTYATGSTTVLPIPTRDGHTFMGWFTQRATDSTLPGDPVTQVGPTESGDKTFYAIWKETRTLYSGNYSYTTYESFKGTTTETNEALNAAYWPQAKGLITNDTTTSNASVASLSAYHTRSGDAYYAVNGIGMYWNDQVNTIANEAYIDINLASGYSFQVTSIRFHQYKQNHETYNRWTAYGDKNVSLGLSSASESSTANVSNDTYWTSFRVQETTRNGEGCLSEVYFAGTLKYSGTGTVTNSTSSEAPNQGTWDSGSPVSLNQYRYSTGADTYTDWERI